MAGIKKLERGLKEKILSLKPGETIEVFVVLKNPALRGQEREEIINAFEMEVNRKVQELGIRSKNLRPYWLLPGFAAALDPSTIEKLLDDPEVEKIAPAQEKVKIPVNRRKIYRPTRALFKDALWQYKPVKASALWEKELWGSGVVVGHLDTGVNSKHPELLGKISGWARVDQYGNVSPEKPENAFDDNGHGTFTGGLIAGGSTKNPLGLAPEAKLISVKVLDRYGSGSLEQIIAGLQYIASKKEVKVVNMSWGVDGYFSILEKPLNNVLLLGILPVAAIGNDGPETSSSPANIPGVLSVGALDFYPRTLNYKYLYPAPFNDTQFVVPKSSLFRFPYYLKPDLLAPGVDVVSTGIKGYLIQSGSSAAAPIVTGLVAALSQKHKLLPQTMISLLKISATNAAKPNYGCGWGIPDAEKILSYLENAAFLEIVGKSAADRPLEARISMDVSGHYFGEVGYIHPLLGRLTFPVPANTSIKLTVQKPKGLPNTIEITTLGTVPIITV
ncbi:S8 family peptidase [Carboxydothermus pertinax]|uniref:Serine protease n=1 Tax=Carboxydothermus pertinax TaxID=870242 RepID=A0A1L8CVL8_9THEO|nr:S8 family serine peptidase [Carboxydothermus pertinax]GAV22941.1 serine protease [Carboxydothermus pertinax]